MAKVLVSDKLDPQGLEILEQTPGLTMVAQPGLKGDELLAAVADAEGLVIRSGTKVPAEVIAAAEKLKVIGRAGIGVDNIDVPAATARGIAVMNTPSGKTSKEDDSYLRKAAIIHKVPYVTTIAAAVAAAKGDD